MFPRNLLRGARYGGIFPRELMQSAPLTRRGAFTSSVRDSRVVSRGRQWKRDGPDRWREKKAPTIKRNRSQIGQRERASVRKGRASPMMQNVSARVARRKGALRAADF